MAAKSDNQNVTHFPDYGPPDPTQIRFPTSMGSEPIIHIPLDSAMSQSIDKRLIFRVRHAATDFPATVEAHKDHTISVLKRYLIEHMEMPFPSRDGKCKIVMVWNKPDLPRDEPSNVSEKDRSEINERYLGGSIDHLRLGDFGLDNGDFLMFTVMFSQIARASTSSFQ